MEILINEIELIKNLSIAINQKNWLW
jgi:hypothetical protein